MTVKGLQKTPMKKANQSELPIVSSFISVMQAFHQNKINIEKLQNQTTPKPIPQI